MVTTINPSDQTITQYTVQVGGASNLLANIGPGSSGQVLQSGGNAANPAYSTATYPSTTTSQQLLYSSAANVIGGLSTGNSLLAATNSSGTLAMRAFSVVIQTFVATGTYTPTAGMLYCVIECVGGGGGSGGCATTGAGTIASSGGGGGGEYAMGVFSAATIGVSKAVTIGAAGLAGTAGNNAGGTGGTTSVGSTLISSIGGSGGAGSSASAVANDAVGGAGGTGGSGGNVRFPGVGGGTGFSNLNQPVLTGFGGGGRFSGGALGGTLANSPVAGNGNGGGASGGSLTINSSQIAGAAGSIGMVVVTEYVIA